MRTLALMICLLMIVPTLAGCFTEETNNNINQDDEWWNTPVHERENMELNMTGWRSQLPVDGKYSWSGPTEHFVEVDPFKLARARAWHRWRAEYLGRNGSVEQEPADEYCRWYLGEDGVLFAEGSECMVR